MKAIEELNDLPASEEFTCPFGLPLREVQRRYVLATLAEHQDNRTHTARTLQIGANTLWRKLKAWGVPPRRRGGPWGPRC